METERLTDPQEDSSERQNTNQNLPENLLPTDLSFTYTENPVSYFRLTAISTNRAITSRVLGADASFSISPQLPEGLIFDATNGSISGIPKVVSFNQAYLVKVHQYDQVR